jgi:antitoxin component of MazEF toxin-antitoxin module
MTVTLKKLGGNLVIPIPARIAHNLGLADGTRLEINVEDGVLRMRSRSRRPRRSMTEIVAQMRTNKRKRPADHQTIRNDSAVGKEVW